MEFKKYHKIPQFKNVVKDIKYYYHSNQLPLPTLKFKGTIKLHGTNAGICYDSVEDKLMAQQRSCLIGDEEVLISQHYGFNHFVHSNYDKLKELCQRILNFFDKDSQITIYGEWAGKGIQKSVGISELDKTFYIFDCKIYDKTTDKSDWIPNLELFDFSDYPVVNLHDLYTEEIEIDFSNPELAKQKLEEYTLEVEQECPIAKHFGVSGIGEGLVWTAYYGGHKAIFKTKGAKHSNTKTKQIVPVDPEVLESRTKFVEFACTENRMKQGLTEVKNSLGRDLENKDIGQLIRWVTKDILAECQDELIANNLEWKPISSIIANKVKNYYFNTL